MTLPTSGKISLGDISVEIFGRVLPLDMNNRYVRMLLGKPSGKISLLDGRGKTWAVPGNRTFSFTGSTEVFSVPRYHSITIEVWAAGGGGTGLYGNDGFCYGYCGGAGGNGGNSSSRNDMIAYGGTGGAAGGRDSCGPAGADGSAIGGNVVIGGGAPGGVGCDPNRFGIAGHGGAGGYVTKTWYLLDQGAPEIGSSIAVNVGAGGPGGPGGENAGPGYPGGNGSVKISWN